MKSGLGPKPPSPCRLSPSKCFFLFFFYFPYSLGRVQYSIVKYLFFTFTHTPCRSVSQQMDIFSSSSNYFQPLTSCSYLAEKNTSFIPTCDPWPTQTWPDLIPLLCYNFCVWFIFWSDKQSDLYSGKCVCGQATLMCTVMAGSCSTTPVEFDHRWRCYCTVLL